MRALQLDPREHLERFAEAHLVREDAAEAAVLQEPEPVNAVLLVRAQHGVQVPGQRLRLDGLRAVLRPRARLP